MGSRPELPKIDYHLHTNLSWCGRESNKLAAIIDKLTNLGYESIGISDHLHPETDKNIFTRIKKEAETFTSIPVLIGCEADVTEVGSTTIDNIETNQFDYIILAPNHYHLNWVDFPENAKVSYAKTADYLVQTHLTAARCPSADIIGHPFAYSWSRKEDVDPVLKEITIDQLTYIVETAVGNEIAFEVSPASLATSRLSCFTAELCRMVCEKGGFLSLGSDAHQIEKVGDVEKVRIFLSDIGIGAEHILNLSPR